MQKLKDSAPSICLCGNYETELNTGCLKNALVLFIQIRHNISANFIFIQIRSYYVKISGNSFGLILLTICSLVSAMRSRKIVVFGVSYSD